ncbi:hypothetical protein HDZ31DRAFT_48117 [Schizophyllum fasciatum]
MENNYTESDFLTFPPHDAQYRLGFTPPSREHVAIYNAWFRTYFSPAIGQLRNRVDNPVEDRWVDLAHVRETLQFSQNWLTFSEVATKMELTRTLFVHLDRQDDEVTDILGEFWGHYYTHSDEIARPRSVDQSPFFFEDLELDAMAAVLAWFSVGGLDIKAMEKMVRTGNTPYSDLSDILVDPSCNLRYWHIFLAGVARHMASDQSVYSVELQCSRLLQPSLRFREIPGWQARFPIMAKASERDEVMGMGKILDPVTLGRVYALRKPDTLWDPSLEIRTCNVFFGVFGIISFVLEELEMTDSAAEQAICAWLELMGIPVREGENDV